MIPSTKFNDNIQRIDDRCEELITEIDEHLSLDTRGSQSYSESGKKNTNASNGKPTVTRSSTKILNCGKDLDKTMEQSRILTCHNQLIHFSNRLWNRKINSLTEIPSVYVSEITCNRMRKINQFLNNEPNRPRVCKPRRPTTVGNSAAKHKHLCTQHLKPISIKPDFAMQTAYHINLVDHKKHSKKHTNVAMHEYYHYDDELGVNMSNDEKENSNTTSNDESLLGGDLHDSSLSVQTPETLSVPKQNGDNKQEEKVPVTNDLRLYLFGNGQEITYSKSLKKVKLGITNFQTGDDKMSIGSSSGSEFKIRDRNNMSDENTDRHSTEMIENTARQEISINPTHYNEKGRQEANEEEEADTAQHDDTEISLTSMLDFNPKFQPKDEPTELSDLTADDPPLHIQEFQPKKEDFAGNLKDVPSITSSELKTSPSLSERRETRSENTQTEDRIAETSYYSSEYPWSLARHKGQNTITNKELLHSFTTSPYSSLIGSLSKITINSELDTLRGCMEENAKYINLLLKIIKGLSFTTCDSQISTETNNLHLFHCNDMNFEKHKKNDVKNMEDEDQKIVGTSSSSDDTGFSLKSPSASPNSFSNDGEVAFNRSSSPGEICLDNILQDWNTSSNCASTSEEIKSVGEI